MNRYQHAFTAECPNNGEAIRYRLTIETAERIMVEEIVNACAIGSTYHEDLADSLVARFGGRQVMSAYHHGVWIETMRGGA